MTTTIQWQNMGINVGAPDSTTFNYLPGGLTQSGDGTTMTWNGRAGKFGNTLDLAVAQAGEEMAIVSNTPIASGTPTDRGAGVQVATQLSGLTTAAVGHGGFGRTWSWNGGLNTKGTLYLQADLKIFGAEGGGNTFGSTSLNQVPNVDGTIVPTIGIAANGNLTRGALGNFAFGVGAYSNTGVWSFDLGSEANTAYGQWRVGPMYFTAGNGNVNAMRLIRADACKFDYLQIMEMNGGWAYLIGQNSRASVFDWINYESGSSAGLQGAWSSGYRKELGYDGVQQNTVPGNVIYRGIKFGMIKTERAGVLYIDSKAEVYDLVTGTNVHMTRRSEEIRITPVPGVGGNISNIGWANRIEASQMWNWFTNRPVVLGIDGTFPPLEKHPLDPAGSLYLPSTKEFVVWMRIADFTVTTGTKEAVAYVERVDNTSGPSESRKRIATSRPTSLQLNATVDNLNSVARDAFTFITALPPAPAGGRLRLGAKLNSKDDVTTLVGSATVPPIATSTATTISATGQMILGGTVTGTFDVGSILNGDGVQNNMWISEKADATNYTVSPGVGFSSVPPISPGQQINSAGYNLLAGKSVSYNVTVPGVTAADAFSPGTAGTSFTRIFFASPVIGASVEATAWTTDTVTVTIKNPASGTPIQIVPGLLTVAVVRQTDATNVKATGSLIGSLPMPSLVLASAGNATSTASTISGHMLAIGGTLTGIYMPGQTISGTGVTAAKILSQPSGITGGAGTYLIGGPAQMVSTPVAINATATGIMDYVVPVPGALPTDDPTTPTPNPNRGDGTECVFDQPLNGCSLVINKWNTGSITVRLTNSTGSTQSLVAGNVTAWVVRSQGSCALDQARAAVNLISGGTFGYGAGATRVLPSNGGPFSWLDPNMRIVAMDDGDPLGFGLRSTQDPRDNVTRGGLKICGGNTENNLQQGMTITLPVHQGQRICVMALVKIIDDDPLNTGGTPGPANITTGLRLTMGVAADGRSMQNFVSMTYQNAIDSGLGDGSKIMQVVFEAPTNYVGAGGASIPSTISLATINNIGCVAVAWIAAIDLDAPTSPMSDGPPISGNWSLGSVVRDTNPTLRGYAEWECNTSTETTGTQSINNSKFMGRTPVNGRVSGIKDWVPGRVDTTAPVTTTLTVSGAQPGDTICGCLFSLPMQGCTLSAVVTAADTVTVTLTNSTTGIVSFGSGKLSAWVTSSAAKTGRFSSAISASQNTVNIPHGLGRVPTNVQVTAKSVKASSVSFYVTESAQNIILNYSANLNGGTADPSGSALVIDWSVS